MDKATIGGLVGGILLITGGILLGSSLLAFVNPNSILIVLGGTAAAVFIGHPTSVVVTGFKAARIAFQEAHYAHDETVKMLSDLSYKARSEGLLSLEAVAEETEDEFLRRGLRLMADGHDQDMVEKILYGEIDKIDLRHRQSIGVWEAVGTYAPAMGMVGTLIGLVQMLQNMEDPSTIGPAMAVALLTTFYGALIANLIGLPLAKKLEVRSAQELMHKELITEGLLSILTGDNPRVMVERLNATLAPEARYKEAA